MQLAKIEKDYRLATGDRMRAELRIERTDDREQQTTEHATTWGTVLRVAISAEVAPKGVRFGTDASGWGQTVDEAPEPLRSLWRRWHLNDMRAACAHMADLPALTERYGPTYDEQITARLAYECEAGSGYKWGHAHLVEPLTHAGALDVLREFDAPRHLAVISRDGIALDVTDNVLHSMHSMQGQSMGYALTYGGYAIELVDGTKVNA